MASLLQAETYKSIPHQIRQNGKSDMGAVSRTTRVFAADRTTYSYDSNPVISVELPASGHFDMAMSGLNFIVAYEKAELLGSAHRLFRRVLIRGSDGRIWAETDNIDVLESILSDCTMNEDQKSHSFSILSLTGDKTRREKAGENGGTFVSIQPLIELCRYEKYLPLHLLGKCTVEMYLQDPRVCFKSGEEKVAYSISNVSYRIDLVQFNSEVEASIMSAWAQDKLRYHFKGWRSTSFTSNAQNALLTVANPDQSVDTVIVSARKTSVVNDKNADSYERWFGNLEEIAVTAGTNIIERVNCRNGAGQAYFELQKALDFSENTLITPAEWTSNKFVLGMNLQVISNNPDGLNGYSGRGDLRIEFFRSQQPSEGILYNVFVLSDYVIFAGQNEGTRKY